MIHWRDVRPGEAYVGRYGPDRRVLSRSAETALARVRYAVGGEERECWLHSLQSWIIGERLPGGGVRPLVEARRRSVRRRLGLEE